MKVGGTPECIEMTLFNDGQAKNGGLSLETGAWASGVHTGTLPA